MQLLLSLRNISLFLLLIVINSAYSFAQVTDSPQTITVDGKLFETGSSSEELLDASVVMRVQVLNPAKSCILYEEQHTFSTLATSGNFNIQVGSAVGDPKRTALDSANNMTTVFYNRSTAITGKTSGGGGCAYTPATEDVRHFRFFVTPSTVGSTSQLSPDMRVDSVPQALVAQTLQGLGKDDVFQTSVTSTQAKLDNLLTTNYSNITDLIGGTSSMYLRNASTGTLLPTRPNDPSTPAAGQLWYDTTANQIKYYNGTAVQTVGAAGSGITSLTAGSGLDGGTITTSGTISISTGGVTNGMLASGIDASKITTGTLPAGVVPTNTDTTKLPLAGGTMTGAITMGAATTFGGFDLLGVGHITMNTQKTITVGRYTGAQETTLISTLMGANAGATWYNSTTNKLMYWNGTSAFELAETTSAGGDITAINTNAGSGLTGGAASGPVTLAIDITGSTAETSVAGADEILIYDASASALRKMTRTNFVLSEAEVDAFVANNGYLTSIAADSLNFSHLADSMTLDASTDIAVNGTDTLSVTNTGTANSFVVNDQTSDTTPFVVDASGNVGIGTPAPDVLLKLRQDSASALDVLTLHNDTPAATGFGPNIEFEGQNGSAQSGVTMGRIGSTWDSNNNNANMDFSTRNSGVVGLALRLRYDGQVNVGSNPAFPPASSKLNVFNASTTGNSAVDGLSLVHSDSNSGGASGIGTRIKFHGESDANNTYPELGVVEAVLDDATDASKDSSLRFYTLGANSGVGVNTATEKMRIDSLGNVGIGTTSPAVTLDMNTKTDAVRLPSGTTAQQPTGANGMIRYNTTTNKFEAYENSAWVDLRSPASNSSLVASTGTAASPSLSFTSETDTGFYNSGTNSIGVSAGGAQVFEFTASALVSSTAGGANILSGNGTAATPTFSFAGDTDTGWFRPAADTMAAATAGAEAMRIASDGNIGIGTTAATDKVTVEFTDTTGNVGGVSTTNKGAGADSWVGYTLTNDAATVGYLWAGSSNYTDASYRSRLTLESGGAVGGVDISAANGSGDIRFRSGGAVERMRLLSSGNVGLGTTAASDRLVVMDTTAASVRVANSTDGLTTNTGTLSSSSTEGAYLTLRNSGSNEWFMRSSTSATRLEFITSNLSNAASMVIQTNGAVGIGTVTPAVSLDLGSRTDAIHVPVGATGARPGTPANGHLRYNTTTSRFEGYENGAWISFTDVPTNSTLVLATGTAAAPSLSFTAENDTGFYNSGTNAIGVSANGTQIFQFTTAALVSPTTGGANLLTGNGSATTPTFGFAGDTNTGFFRSAADTIGISVGGTKHYDISSAGIVAAGAGGPVILTNGSGNSAPSYSFNGDTNTGMNRVTTDWIGFSTNGVNQVSIDSNGFMSIGNIGVPTTAPASRLDVSGVITSRPYGNTAGQTGQVALRELAVNGTEAAIIRVPDALGANYTLTLPVDDGTANQVLSTNGSGDLSWVNVLSSGSTIAAADGSAATPGLSFASDVDTGWFRPSADTLAASTAGVEHMRIDSSGNIGIGTTSTTSRLEVNQTRTDTSGTIYMTRNELQVTPSGASTGSFVSMYNQTIVSGTNTVDIAMGASNRVSHNGSANLSNAIGTYSQAVTTGPTTMSTGVSGVANNFSTAAVGTATGINGRVLNSSTGAITTARSLHADYDNTGGGSITTWYGLYVSPIAGTAPTNRYPIYVADTGNNYFAGNVGIGTTGPSVALDVVGTVRSSQQLAGPGGSAAVPGLLLDGATDDWGLYVSGSSLGFGRNLGTYVWLMTNSSFSGNGGTGSAALYSGVGRSAVNPVHTFVGDTNTGVFNAADDTLGFTTNGVEKVRIDATGNVGIGTTTIGAKLHVNGTLRVDTLNAATATQVCIDGSNILSACTSSIRYKENVHDLNSSIDTLLALRPVTYDWKNTKKTEVGFIAEEVEKVDPLLVTYEKDGRIQGVKYDLIVAPIVKAFQELYRRFVETDSRVVDLEKNTNTINDRITVQLRQLASIKNENEKLKASDKEKDLKIKKMEQENIEIKARLEKIEKALLKK